MKFFVYFAKGFVCDVCVYLGCCYRGMAEKFLDGSYVGSVDEELGGETVS